MYNLKATIKQFLETVESDTPSAFKPILDKYFDGVDPLENVNYRKIGPKRCPYYNGDHRVCIVPCVGSGGQAYVPALAFLGEGQTTTDGIYPVLLYYCKLDSSDKQLILSYGYSSTKKPISKWTLPAGTIQIKDHFKGIKEKYDSKKLNYQDSYIYSVYKPEFTDNIIDVISKDVDKLIKYYIETVIERQSSKEVISKENNKLEYKNIIAHPDIEPKENYDTLSTSSDLSFLNSTFTPSQTIYYGAPGTGKSHTIKKKEKDGLHCIRTTFHPDSDYATFVGCYKPHYNRETGKITYKFVEQAFLTAYLQAWKDPQQEVALVIEEINRGNCAQIFGDIFQLLDRDDDGWSTYPVKADTNISEHLEELNISGYSATMANRYGKDKAGYNYMALPPNMSFLATMNTSDQSLFPIDSAFKRRWEWKYIKIKEGKDENGNKLDWKVDVKMDESGTLLPWWDFIKKINEIIASMTSSADKQLGYFFCCAKDDVIDEETFVSKVIFYLWNDVFKDYGFEDASLFRYTTKDEDGKDAEKNLTFPDFYDEEGEKVNTERLTDFVKKVMSWRADDKRDDDK